MRRSVHHATWTVVHRVAGSAALWGAAAAALLWAPPAPAFGPSGHRVAGLVAERYLCPETKVALDPLLGGMTLADAGLWPDSIRRQPEWEHTRPWHFINVPDRGSVSRAARRDADNVLAALARFERELGDPSLDNARRGIALRFVVHFVVDIHQPLHVGRTGDRGGNLVPVLVSGKETNLHALWDGEPLVLPGSPGPRDRAQALTQALTHALARPAPAMIRRWQGAGPLDWARESLGLRRQVYAFPPGEGPVALSPAYLDQARETVDQRLLQAGVRLAGRLNATLGPRRPCSVEVASSQSTL